MLAFSCDDGVIITPTVGDVQDSREGYLVTWLDTDPYLSIKLSVVGSRT